MALWQVIFWAVVTVLLIGAEIASVQMIAIWFAAGGLAAFVSSFFGLEFWVQILIFIAGSILLLLATRPLVRKFFHGTGEKTNADSLIGKECVIREDVDNLAGKGRAFVSGLTWAARNVDGDIPIPAGTACRIVEIQGVKLMVRPLQK